MKYIPKIIHLIWFGGNPYSPIVERCIASWEKYCPDYEIKVWNEETFDVNINNFTKEAYMSKKWAFVSDYVRLYALYNDGGVYIDSDVELLKGIDDVLENEHAVTGYSSSIWIPTGLMAAERNNFWIKTLLSYYDDRPFILEDGNFDMKVNNAIITQMSKEYFNFKVGDLFIEKGNVKLYPREYFHPVHKKTLDYKNVDLDTVKENFKITDNTYCVHYGTATWVSNRDTFLYKLKHIIRQILPQFIIDDLERIYFGFRKWDGK